MSYCHIPHYCGIYYIPVPTTLVPPHPHWLPQVSLSTLSKIHDTASSTTLTQTFVNPSQNSPIPKAKYTFPLYESCAVVAFRCYVGKRLIEGVVKEKAEAKAEYNEAVEKGETAGLLEQHTPDVFSTSLGNIPAGETVKVEIEYLIELKHDAEIDGLRFTIPTSIAPRYGDTPAGVDTYSTNCRSNATQGGMKISVQVTMPSNVRSVQSPSHNIAIHLGGHAENTPDAAFNPKHALTTLSHSSTTLDKDFVLLVKCADLSFPRAILEPHPTIPNSSALMITLVPKFTLPPGPKPEIVFVVDRSGSMGQRMAPLKSALLVFLKSLPIGTKFNICSFGSRFAFLWKKSKSYSADTLAEATKHVQSMEANFGGTEILPAVKATVSQRFADLSLEVMVLTDGEVWNTTDLFDYIGQATQKGDVRVFSLGIGQDVSHALVEGMARVGKGFAQIVADEHEGMEGKVVRMLKGGLSAHVNDYTLEWDGKPREESGKRKAPSSSVVDKVKKKISLFNATAETEAPVSFTALPEFVVPSVLQAPYKLPPLFPFSRYTAYAILSGDTPPPSVLRLRGTTSSGEELELEVPVQVVGHQQDDTVHKLAARKILQELEEGVGYLHSGKYGVDKKTNAGTFDEWVKREGVRVGVKYGVASRWTSFVAVQKKKDVGMAKEKGKKPLEKDVDMESVTEVGDDDFEMVMDGDTDCNTEMDDFISSEDRARISSLGLMKGNARRKISLTAGSGHSAQRSRMLSPSMGTGSMGMGLIGPLPPSSFKQSRRKPASTTRPMPSQVLVTAGVSRRSFMTPMGSMGSPERENRSERKRSSIAIVSQQQQQQSIIPFIPVAGKPGGTHQQTMELISLQTFEGSFQLTSSLATLLGTTLADLEAKMSGFVPNGGLSGEMRRTLWATVLVVGMFERRLGMEKDVWELVVEKAKAWMGTVGYGGVERSAGLVGEVLGVSMA